MTRPSLFWTATLLLAAATLAGAAVSAFGPERVALTAGDLQERVNRALPRQFHNVTVDRATVTLADGRITVRAETRAAALGKTIATAAVARGVPQYNAEHGEVFFDADDVKIEDSGSGGLVKQLGIRIGGRLGEQVEKNMPRVEDAAAGLVAGSIKAWLASRPVYRFKDDVPGLVFKATLKNLAVEGDTLVVGVSLIRLTGAVAAWLCGLALVVLGAAWLWVARGREEQEHFEEAAAGQIGRTGSKRIAS
jgi:hypothetical protein